MSIDFDCGDRFIEYHHHWHKRSSSRTLMHWSSICMDLSSSDSKRSSIGGEIVSCHELVRREVPFIAYVSGNSSNWVDGRHETMNKSMQVTAGAWLRKIHSRKSMRNRSTDCPSPNQRSFSAVHYSSAAVGNHLLALASLAVQRIDEANVLFFFFRSDNEVSLATFWAGKIEKVRTKAKQYAGVLPEKESSAHTLLLSSVTGGFLSFHAIA